MGSRKHSVETLELGMLNLKSRHQRSLDGIPTHYINDLAVRVARLALVSADSVYAGTWSQYTELGYGGGMKGGAADVDSVDTSFVSSDLGTQSKHTLIPYATVDPLTRR